MRTLIEALDRAAQSDAGYVFAGAQGDCHRPYAAIQASAFRVAGALRDAGVKRGDLVALIISDPQTFLTTLFGVSIAAAIPATLPPPAVTAHPDRHLELTGRLLRGARARAIVADRGLLERLAAFRGLCPDLQIALAGEALDGRPVGADIAPSLDDIALVQFTSGSTFEPKGVSLSHRNLCANIDAINGPSGLGTTSSDSAASWLPLYHDMGLVGMALGPLYSARPGLFMTPQAFVKHPAAWLKAIARHKATVSFAPNFGYEQVVRRVKDQELEGLDLSCWRVAGCGAEPIHAPTLDAFAERLASVGFQASSFLPCYGLAEHVLAAAFPPRGRPPRLDESASGALISCGRALPGHRIRIVTEEGRDAPEREIGEIALAGPSVMLGYYQDAAGTAETIRDGWLYTGDLGYMSAGELYVCGRVKDLIIANGRKYHPQDLEWTIDDLEGVRRGRTVAIGVSTRGRADRVVIVLEAAATASPDTVTDAVRRRIGDAFGLYVSEVVVAPAGTIGRTTSGKLQRAAVKKWYSGIG
jgi:acyl-CoA synthetase (AMP-forming)/AMP-acid ligase II